MNVFIIYRAIDLNALIGTIGGYIGLFLGYSFLQIPQAILGIYGYFQKRHQKELEKDTVKSFA